MYMTHSVQHPSGERSSRSATARGRCPGVTFDRTFSGRPGDLRQGSSQFRERPASASGACPCGSRGPDSSQGGQPPTGNTAKLGLLGATAPGSGRWGRRSGSDALLAAVWDLHLAQRPDPPKDAESPQWQFDPDLQRLLQDPEQEELAQLARRVNKDLEIRDTLEMRNIINNMSRGNYTTYDTNFVDEYRMAEDALALELRQKAHEVDPVTAMRNMQLFRRRFVNKTFIPDEVTREIPFEAERTFEGNVQWQSSPVTEGRPGQARQQGRPTLGFSNALSPIAGSPALQRQGRCTGSCSGGSSFTPSWGGTFDVASGSSGSHASGGVRRPPGPSSMGTPGSCPASGGRRRSLSPYSLGISRLMRMS